MDEDDLAYDGSNNPPKRELTARERDILCRVLSEILNHARHNPPVWSDGLFDGSPIPGWIWGPVPITIGEPGFFGVLWEIRKIINPRNE